jgi:hypothetical protein
MFHSIYGTEFFGQQTLSLSRRGELCGLIGEPAENLAYLYSATSRESRHGSLLRQGGLPLTDWRSGHSIT